MALLAYIGAYSPLGRGRKGAKCGRFWRLAAASKGLQLKDKQQVVSLKAKECRKHAGLRYGVRKAKTRAISQSGQWDNRGEKVIFLVFLSVKNAAKTQKSHATSELHDFENSMGITLERVVVQTTGESAV